MVQAMRVEQDVLEVLDRAKVEGPALRLVGTLDRKLYVRVNKVLEAAGGKWSRKARAHLFEGEAAEAIENVILTGEITRPQDFGQFDSPPEVVARVIDLARIGIGMSVLEPSAGIGNLAVGAMELTPDVRAVEIDPKRVEKLQRIEGLVVREADFLAVPSLGGVFDRVVMNPPFAKQDDIRHVMHAARFLKDGGRLVSVMSSGVTFRENQLTRKFREFVEAHCGTIDPLPEGAFKGSGTMVRSVIVAFDV